MYISANRGPFPIDQTHNPLRYVSHRKIPKLTVQRQLMQREGGSMHKNKKETYNTLVCGRMSPPQCTALDSLSSYLYAGGGILKTLAATPYTVVLEGQWRRERSRISLCECVCVYSMASWERAMAKQGILPQMARAQNKCENGPLESQQYPHFELPLVSE